MSKLLEFFAPERGYIRIEPEPGKLEWYAYRSRKDLRTRVAAIGRFFVGENVVIGTGCTIYAGVAIGDNCTIAEDCTLNYGVTLAPRCKVGDGVIFGRACHVGEDTHISGGCRFGQDVMIGRRAYIGRSVKIEKLSSVSGDGIVPAYAHIPESLSTFQSIGVHPMPGSLSPITYAIDNFDRFQWAAIDGVIPDIRQDPPGTYYIMNPVIPPGHQVHYIQAFQDLKHWI